MVKNVNRLNGREGAVGANPKRKKKGREENSAVRGTVEKDKAGN